MSAMKPRNMPEKRASAIQAKESMNYAGGMERESMKKKRSVKMAAPERAKAPEVKNEKMAAHDEDEDDDEDTMMMEMQEESKMSLPVVSNIPQASRPQGPTISLPALLSSQSSEGFWTNTQLHSGLPSKLKD
jgi:hypothetical protein